MACKWMDFFGAVGGRVKEDVGARIKEFKKYFKKAKKNLHKKIV